MEDFSRIYEKLIYMGFPASAVDSAIARGLYTFMEIFTDLAAKEELSTDLIESSSVSQTKYIQQRFKDKNVGDGVINSEDSYCRKFSNDGDFARLQLSDKESDENSFTMTQTVRQPKMEVMTKYPRITSSTMSSSLLSTNIIDSSTKNMTKIQIMDLLDPAIEPHTYSQPFLASVCSIRDLICWFCQARSTVNKIIETNKVSSISRVAISIRTDMHSLINLFENNKWHFVLPSGTNSLRIYGRDNLDKFLDQLGLAPKAHLLAIVGSPLQLRQSDSPLSSNNNHSIVEEIPIVNVVNDSCVVQIRMVNYRNNPLYLQGRSSFKNKYSLDSTILSDVVNDFSAFCQLDLSSFVFLRLDSGKQLSNKEDYFRSLHDLKFQAVTTLYCHSRSPNSDLTNQSMSSHLSDSLSIYRSLTGTSNNNHSSHFPLTPQFSVVSDTKRRSASPLRTRLLLSDSQVDSRVNQYQQSSLFRLCLSVIYRGLKNLNSVLCREVRRLPNNILQILIKQFIVDQSLTAAIMTHFCTPDSRLVTLDLSYTIMATDELLSSVSKCSGLQEIVLDNEQHVFTNDGLSSLRSCLCLRRLSLNHCPGINDHGLQLVASLPNLAVLSVRHTAITDLGLELLRLAFLQTSALPSPLTSLDLSQLPISDRASDSLAFFGRHLQLLNLASTALEDPSSLPLLPLLHHLDLSHCPSLSWHRQAISLHDLFPSLTSISLSPSTSPSSNCLFNITNSLAHCSNLRHIEGLFSHPRMTASLVTSLSHLPLDSIVLSNCPHVNDLWLPAIATFSATLNHLVISSCRSVSGANNCLLNNLRRLSYLSWLDLTHLENVDSQQICQLVLQGHFPRMQVFWFSLTEQEEFLFRPLVKHVHFKINITRSLRHHIPAL